MECIDAQTRLRFLLSVERDFGEMESEPMLTTREKCPLLDKFSSEEDRTHDTASSRTQRAQHTTKELFRPHTGDWGKKKKETYAGGYPARQVALKGQYKEWPVYRHLGTQQV